LGSYVTNQIYETKGTMLLILQGVALSYCDVFTYRWMDIGAHWKVDFDQLDDDHSPTAAT